MFQKKNNWGGNRKSEIDFVLDAPTVRIPKPYHKAAQEFVKQLEDADIESGKIYQDDNGNWVYRD